MTSILICHAQDDAAAAKDLGAALATRGLRVWFVGDVAKDPNWLSALYIYSGVVILWSKTSIGSLQIQEYARAAHLVNRLVPVRAEALTVESLPTEFRLLSTPLISDLDAIERVLAHLRPPTIAPETPDWTHGGKRVVLDVGGRGPGAKSIWSDFDRGGKRSAPEVGAAEPRRHPFETLDIGSGSGGASRRRTEGVGAAAEPSRPFPRPSSPSPNAGSRTEGVGSADGAKPRITSVVAPQHEALAVEAGRMVHKIPEKMWVGEPEPVEVRLGRAETEGLTQGLVGRGALSSQDIPILETMSVSIYANGGAFDIERQSETTQLVSRDRLKGTAFEQADYGRWVWLITPRKSGTHQLFVKVSASLKDSRGLPTSASLPDREFPVSVSVHTGKATVRILRRSLLAAGGAIGAGLLGAITQELWWPKLKVLLQSGGWLN